MAARKTASFHCDDMSTKLFPEKCQKKQQNLAILVKILKEHFPPTPHSMDRVNVCTKIFLNFVLYVNYILENNPKQIRALIGLKPCFYNSIETQKLARAVDEQSKFTF